jgi:hypothetical protein
MLFPVRPRFARLYKRADKERMNGKMNECVILLSVFDLKSFKNKVDDGSYRTEQWFIPSWIAFLLFILVPRQIVHVDVTLRKGIQRGEKGSLHNYNEQTT